MKIEIFKKIQMVIRTTCGSSCMSFVLPSKMKVFLGALFVDYSNLAIMMIFGETFLKRLLQIFSSIVS